MLSLHKHYCKINSLSLPCLQAQYITMLLTHNGAVIDFHFSFPQRVLSTLEKFPQRPTCTCTVHTSAAQHQLGLMRARQLTNGLDN